MQVLTFSTDWIAGVAVDIGHVSEHAEHAQEIGS